MWDQRRPNLHHLIIAALVVAGSSPAHAQIDEAKKYWDVAKGQYTTLLDRAAKKQHGEASKSINDLRTSYDEIDKRLAKVGTQLHPKDRVWLGTRHQDLIGALGRLRTVSGVLQVKLKEIDKPFDAELARVKTEWDSFSKSVDQLWVDYGNHHRELIAILEAFRKDCPGCR
jgi:hypothetical protein